MDFSRQSYIFSRDFANDWLKMLSQNIRISVYKQCVIVFSTKNFSKYLLPLLLHLKKRFHFLLLHLFYFAFVGFGVFVVIDADEEDFAVVEVKCVEIFFAFDLCQSV